VRQVPRHAPAPTMPNANHGSLTTAIAVLLSLEVAAALLLFGGQVIAEFDRIGRPGATSRAVPFTTGPR